MSKSLIGSTVAVSGASLLVLAAMIAAPAYAQETPPAEPAPAEQPAAEPETDAATQGEQDIVVTGIRSSLQGALNAKRNSAQVLDAISAEDIGKFPDKNIGEALQRVTGVQLTRSDGEGSGVTIRGADPSLNRVEINGTSALSTTVGGGRDVDFRDLPSEFVNRLEVVKSATADMTEGGVGGTVRVITRRPFDNGGDPFLAGSAQVIYADIGDHMDPKFALIGSDTFADGTIGVLLSGTYENRNVESHQARTTGWKQDMDPRTPGVQGFDLDDNGMLDFFPDIPRYVMNRLETQRYALNGILEWRPSDDFKAYYEGNYTRSKQSVTSQFLQTGTTGGIVDTENSITGPDDTVSYLVYRNDPSQTVPNQLGVAYRNILGDITRTTFNSAIGAEWTTGKLTLTPKISYAKAKAYNNEINATASVLGMDSLIVDYRNEQQSPQIILPNDPTTTNGVNRLTVQRRPRYDQQEEYMGKLDAEYKPDGGFFTSFKAGGQWRRLTVDSKLFNTTTTLDGFSNPAVQSRIDEALGYSDIGNTAFFHTGNLGFDDGYQRWLNINEGVANFVGIPDPFGNQTFTDTWEVREQNIAGYAQASFEIDLGSVPLTGVVGARVVNTKTDTSGFLSAGGVVSPVAFDGEVTEFLPSINLKAELLPNKLFARATATEVMARPLPQQLAPRFTLDVVGLSGSRGNPELEPFRARQYDLGLEYYINRTSFASVTYFRKEIGSFIQNTTEPYTDPTTNVVYNITFPTNGTQKVTINGVEAGLQVAFDFLEVPVLKNMGVLANYTYSKDSGYEGRDVFTGAALPFQGLSRNSYNISAYYEDDVISLRGAYNWRSKYLIVAQGRGNNPEFGEAYGQLDASLNITLMPEVSLFLEGVNLLDATRKENANSVYRRTIVETFGRRVYGGIRFKL
ncbi:TonB-dependent receptor [Sphingomonas sanxanigenens]|uniref:TonB-dependent receptor n=1 Tax=Sphingomonas sanxanigenens TaxID=397260 RepID=UPI000587438C|nr:TonB-dependent receptor [Sphingomonas sanxanigenens]